MEKTLWVSEQDDGLRLVVWQVDFVVRPLHYLLQ